MKSSRPTRHAFTLLEGLLSIVIIAVIAAVTLPVVTGAADNYAYAAAARRSTEEVAFAMERAVRFLRDAPAGAAANTIDIASATPTEVVFADGTSLALEGDQLMLAAESGSGEGVLLDGVEEFEVRYLAQDGATDCAATPQSTHRFVITVKAGGAELRCVAFPRVRMVPQ
ncbi:MAG TPA: prepilin-type N-terminal cleavage/methylation domain-containing protein [Phycisphaerales bacterium]|nr:prepilin-type N-terminal cleavage/methylation domain-containing protein [Phycisphaerales bacterium]